MAGELAFRPHTWDRNIWDAVARENEYQLAGPFSPADTVLDIGAHIGSFAYRALDMGAGRVVCVEPDPDSFHYLRHNLHAACEATDRAVLVYGAAVASGSAELHPPVFVAAVGTNTGGSNTIGGNGVPVAGLEVDDLVQLATSWNRRPLRLLKLDCEGMEWSILERADLRPVQAIVGEWHGIDETMRFPMLHMVGRRGRAELVELLRTAGFRVATRPTSEYLGLFWAWREGQEFAQVDPDGVDDDD